MGYMWPEVDHYLTVGGGGPPFSKKNKEKGNKLGVSSSKGKIWPVYYIVRQI